MKLSKVNVLFLILLTNLNLSMAISPRNITHTSERNFLKVSSSKEADERIPIIFKLDDFRVSDPNPVFFSVLSLFQEYSISVSLGVILDSTNNYTSYAFLKNLCEDDSDIFFHGIEHWNKDKHTLEEFGIDVSYHKQLVKFQQAITISERFGLEMIVFGAPGNGYSDFTKKALIETGFKGMFVKNVEEEEENHEFVGMNIDFSDLNLGFFTNQLTGKILYDMWITPFLKDNLIVIQLHPFHWRSPGRLLALEQFFLLLNNEKRIRSISATEYVSNVLYTDQVKIISHSQKEFVISGENLSNKQFYLFDSDENQTMWELIDLRSNISLFRWIKCKMLPVFPNQNYLIRKYLEERINFSISQEDEQIRIILPVNQKLQFYHVFIENERSDIFRIINTNYCQNLSIVLSSVQSPQILKISVVFQFNDTYRVLESSKWFCFGKYQSSQEFDFNNALNLLIVVSFCITITILLRRKSER
ncbi:MAG: DUF2334 domain-containing protein [Promethearchaeota archaeon]